MTGVNRSRPTAPRVNGASGIVDSPHTKQPLAKGPWPRRRQEGARRLMRLVEQRDSTMKANTPGRAHHALAAAGLLIALGLSATAPAALAQGQVSVSRSESVTGKVTIKSIDPATRHVVVTDSAGESHSMKVPPEVRNFDQLKAGDTIKATYSLEAEFVLSKPNAPLPPDTEATITARAAKGELPAAVAANHIVVTGAVVGVDVPKHTLKIVSPQGGEVHTVVVTSPDGQKAMGKVKVGDKITAYVTESLLIAAEPA